MPPSKISYDLPSDAPRSVLREGGIEDGFIGKLQGLKYEYRRDITDRAALERNFREKFEALNRCRLTDSEFARLVEIITPDVFAASKTLRGINAFTRDDFTPLNYTLVNIKDWRKNTSEVINQLRVNTDNIRKRGPKGERRQRESIEPLPGRLCRGKHQYRRQTLHPSLTGSR